MPISSRKLSASIFTVGCLCTNALIGSAASIMIATEMTTAAIITHSSSTMPTAVITESSEKTMSSSMIWTITLANDAATRPEPWPSSPSSCSWISNVLLREQEQPAADQDQIAARRSPDGRCAVNSGVGQLDDPGQREQQQHARDHRAEQAQSTRARAAARPAAFPTGSR